MKQILLQLLKIFTKILLRVYFGRTYVCKRKYLMKFLRYFQINISSIKTAEQPEHRRMSTICSQKCSRCKGFTPYGTFYIPLSCEDSFSTYRPMINATRQKSYQRKITINPEKRERMEGHLSPSIMACRDHVNTDFLGRLASCAFLFRIDRSLQGWRAITVSHSSTVLRFSLPILHSYFCRVFSSNGNNRGVCRHLRQRLFQCYIKLSFQTYEITLYQ